MRQARSTKAISGRKSGAIALVAVAGAVAMLTAGPARADGDFENAFEATLGHLAAYEAVNLGRYILSGGGYYASPPGPYYPPSYAYGYAYPYPVRHVVRYRHVHGHKHGWNCGHSRHYWSGHGRHRGYDYDRWDDDDDRGHRRHGKHHRRGHDRGW